MDSDYITERMKLKNWQETFDYDLHSRISPYQLPIYSITDNYTNMFLNGTFDNDISFWSCWSPFGNCNASWEASSKLDNGSLKLSFGKSSDSPEGRMLVTQNLNDLSEGESYILKFSMVSSNPGKKIEILLRRNIAPYFSIAKSQTCLINTSRQEYELLFIPDSSESNARIDLIINEDGTSYWLDNVEFYKVDIEMTSTSDSLLLVYNAGDSLLTINDNNYYVDVKGNIYHNFDLQPFNSLILLKIKDEDFPFGLALEQDILLMVYPNPTNSIINILTNYNDYKIIRLLDLSGRVVYEEDSVSDFISIDITSFSKGPYIISLIGERGIVSSRIIVM